MGWEISDWEQEFDQRFGDNLAYWQEIRAEVYIGDPDFGGLKRFIKECIDKARKLERQSNDQLYSKNP